MDISLKHVQSDIEWNTYHRLRRTILFENRGKFGIYDPNHPDETKHNNFPMILNVNGKLLGVIRIDIEPSTKTAYFRRVAIAQDEQNQGLGSVLMKLAEKFALSKSCKRFEANVARNAIRFYQKLGYSLSNESSQEEEENPLMIKSYLDN